MAEDLYGLDGYAETPVINPVVLAYGAVALSGAVFGVLLGWMLWA